VAAGKTQAHEPHLSGKPDRPETLRRADSSRDPDSFGKPEPASATCERNLRAHPLPRDEQPADLHASLDMSAIRGGRQAISMTSRTRAVPRTSVERAAARQAGEIRGRIAAQLRTAREDAGLSLERVAHAGGVSKSRLHDIEGGSCQPRWETIARVCMVLGLRLGVGLYPNAGPLIRDHLQAAMIEALLGILDPRWRGRPEVPVHRPVRGVIDLVLDEGAGGAVVACEAQSELRRLEQQLRWSRAKAEALQEARRDGDTVVSARDVGRLMLLRSTTRTRATVAQYADVVAAAYPARTKDAYSALAGQAPWPGDALIWCHVEGQRAEVLKGPPRGIRVGR